MLTLANSTNVTLEPSPKHQHKSFEQFRKAGASHLAELKPGQVGLISTKSCDFRILGDDDFQSLVGARSAMRLLEQRLRMVIDVSITVVKHKDDATLAALKSVIQASIDLPGIKTQVGHGPLEEDNMMATAPDDEAEGLLLDPEEIYREMEHGPRGVDGGERASNV